MSWARWTTVLMISMFLIVVFSAGRAEARPSYYHQIKAKEAFVHGVRSTPKMFLEGGLLLLKGARAVASVPYGALKRVDTWQRVHLW